MPEYVPETCEADSAKVRVGSHVAELLPVPAHEAAVPAVAKLVRAPGVKVPTPLVEEAAPELYEMLDAGTVSY